LSHLRKHTKSPWTFWLGSPAIVDAGNDGWLDYQNNTALVIIRGTDWLAWSGSGQSGAMNGFRRELVLEFAAVALFAN
jgi:hypothetical protein